MSRDHSTEEVTEVVTVAITTEKTTTEVETEEAEASTIIEGVTEKTGTEIDIMTSTDLKKELLRKINMARSLLRVRTGTSLRSKEVMAEGIMKVEDPIEEEETTEGKEAID